MIGSIRGEDWIWIDRHDNAASGRLLPVLPTITDCRKRGVRDQIGVEEREKHGKALDMDR